MMAVILLILLTPLIIIIILLQFSVYGSKILFYQERSGLNGRVFSLIKFRTMIDKSDISGRQLPDKQRLTSSGKILRFLSLDELPNIINVVKGDLSFVGPRPALYNQDDLIAMRTERGVEVLVPGITGWAQVNGRDELDLTEKVNLDAQYLQKQSTGFDFYILFLTVLKVFRREGVSH